MPTKQICGSNELSERCIAQGGWDGPIHGKLCVLGRGGTLDSLLFYYLLKQII